MTQKLKHVFGRVDVRVLLVLSLLAAAFFVAIAQEKTELSYDAAEYQELHSHRLDSVYDLEHWFAAQQEALLPILPPYADCVLTNQTGLPEILPFTVEKFPKDFRAGLAGIYEYSVPVYPVRLVEDTKTRALLFYNYDGKLFYTLESAAEYDPFSYLKDLMPWLYAGRANSAGMAYWEGLYDPARIQIVTKLIAAEDMEHWLYAKAKVEAAAEALEDEGGGSMMMRVATENATTNIVFTEVKKVTNGVSMTVAYPSWFTNRLDLFMCSDLPPEIWSFATLSLPTTGTNLTWVDTNYWVTAGNPTRLYAAADATKDSDGDGYQDGREIMVYDTDPNVATSRPVKVSGTISYGGPESGTIYILFSTQSNNWSLTKSLAMSSPGAYTNEGIGNHQSCWFNAFRDVNANFTRDAWEPWGVYSQTSTLITGDTSGINITLHDVPSVWGQISYSGTATGDIHVIAVASSNSWESTYETIIPYVRGVGPSGEQYFVTFPASYQITDMPASNYWIRAFMDVDTNGVPSEADPSGQYAAAATGVSNRVTGLNVTLIADSDSDGLPDWWEYQYFAGLGQDGGGDPDGDGFDNAQEYELKSKPNSAKWNGQQLAYKILHAHASSGPGLRSPHPEGMHVDIEDSVREDCGGSNDGVQDKVDPLDVPELEESGYFMDITVEGKVEDHQYGFDVVTFESCTNTYYFQGHDNRNKCAMASESATRNVFIAQNSTVQLRYDTVDALYHVGAYAEVTAATETDVLKVKIEKCSSSFDPKGGSEDNTTTIRAFVTPDALKGMFKFTLTDVSSEPGYCLNGPKPAPGSGEDSDAWKDLQFPDQTGFTISGSDRDVAETTASDVSEATVTVKSFDYGAFARIKADFFPNGTCASVTALEQGGSKSYTSIPKDDDDNHIWDGWPSFTGSSTEDVDKNTDNSVWGTDGDGLSAYEEYRGVIYINVYHRLNPATKDVFVHDPDLVYGTTSFGSIGSVNFIPVGEVFDGNRVINFNHGTAHIADQHVLVVERADLGGAWSWGRVIQPACEPNSPKDSGTVQVDQDQIITDCD